MTELADLIEQFKAKPIDGAVNMAGYGTADTPFIDSKSEANNDVENNFPDRLFDAHELMFSHEDRSLLLVLQGLDASGKNGTIKHVVIHMNPAGVQTSSFTEPSEEELEHHFLWRVKNALPQPGHLGVFDRSHYEDLLVPLATGQEDPEAVQSRAEEIVAFESDLVDNGTTIVKCMLHISYDEQRERFLRRLRRDDKRWKFVPSDLETRRLWNEYQAAYGSVIAATSTDKAPWLIIPADNKWYRNWAIGSLLIETLRDMNLDYPQPDLDVEAMRLALAEPN